MDNIKRDGGGIQQGKAHWENKRYTELDDPLGTFHMAIAWVSDDDDYNDGDDEDDADDGGNEAGFSLFFILPSPLTIRFHSTHISYTR